MKSDAPIAAKPGQAYFMTRGTPHGFKNVGPTPAAVFEIFIKQTMTAAGGGVAAALAVELAALGASISRDSPPTGRSSAVSTRSALYVVSSATEPRTQFTKSGDCRERLQYRGR